MTDYHPYHIILVVTGSLALLLALVYVRLGGSTTTVDPQPSINPAVSMSLTVLHEKRTEAQNAARQKGEKNYSFEITQLPPTL